MKKVLIAYFSPTGTTERMAEFIAEGIRFSGKQAKIEKVENLKETTELAGFDGYIFGSPTYSLDVPKRMKTFLTLAGKVDMRGKLGGAFGSYAHDVGYQHDTHAPAIIFNALQANCGMKPFKLGPLNLKEDLLTTAEGLKACQAYGKVFGEELDASV